MAVSPAIVQGPDGAKVLGKWARPHFRLASVCRLALASADGMVFANMRNQEVASMGIGFFH
jgi:hypothetical protein